jgi:hypothetical protein
MAISTIACESDVCAIISPGLHVYAKIETNLQFNAVPDVSLSPKIHSQHGNWDHDTTATTPRTAR